MIPIKKLSPTSMSAFAGRLKNIPFFARLFARLSLLNSQAGQDFWVYGEAFNQARNGYFLDIGAHDGINISNTFALESKYSWSGLCVEANPETFKRLKRNRKATCVNTCLDQTEGEVDFILREGRGGIAGHNLDNSIDTKDSFLSIKMKTMTLTKLLEIHDAPQMIDYLSIDVEGAEERILIDFDFNAFTFKTITVERPSKQLRSCFRENGYILIKEIPNLDCFYIHKSFKKEYKKNLFSFYSDKNIKIAWR